jgi:hypothetical protein
LSRAAVRPREKVKLLLPTKRGLFYFSFVFVVAAAQSGARQTAPGVPSTSGWVLTWSDEFDGPNGSAPDSNKWIAESGGNGWGNNELETYTARSKNVREENGELVIEAINCCGQPWEPVSWRKA